MDRRGSRHRDASLESKEQIKVAGDPWLIGDTEMGHKHVGLAIRAGTGHGKAQPISLA